MAKKKEMTVAYVYADGHVVVCYNKRDKDLGDVEYVEIHEKWSDCYVSMKSGRVVLHRGFAKPFLDLLKKARRVEARPHSTENGSPNSKAKGLAVSTLWVEFDNFDHLCFYDIGDLLSNGFVVQPKVNDTFEASASNYYWGVHRIARVHRKEKSSEHST